MQVEAHSVTVVVTVTCATVMVASEQVLADVPNGAVPVVEPVPTLGTPVYEGEKVEVGAVGTFVGYTPEELLYIGIVMLAGLVPVTMGTNGAE